MIEDECFFAWLDGELDDAEAAKIEALVAADPALQRKAAAHRALGTRLRSAFDPVAAQPVPPRLADASLPRETQVIDLASRRPAARPISVRAQWAAMAASLVLGIGVGTMVTQGGSSPVTREAGQLVASEQLETALYTRLASAPAEEGARIGLTFRDAKGDLCRSFTDEGMAGLACHQGGDWRIRGLFQGGEGQQSGFRMASGADPRLAAMIDSIIAGEPLDAEGEREALDALR